MELNIGIILVCVITFALATIMSKGIDKCIEAIKRSETYIRARQRMTNLARAIKSI